MADEKPLHFQQSIGILKGLEMLREKEEDYGRLKQHVREVLLSLHHHDLTTKQRRNARMPNEKPPHFQWNIRTPQGHVEGFQRSLRHELLVF
ncbi:hypothetical protein PanWU01x14_009520 [Parasponia andersonii]|uniref:Uncharacterized protein n=1 Tax=Parasponia andersonii TaxID=3476 RepID=A0A2P5E2F4_PARAD|nr:hypothetical protein PanWU01x14_009520 [Parasponia andersonii]